MHRIGISCPEGNPWFNALPLGDHFRCPSERRCPSQKFRGALRKSNERSDNTFTLLRHRDDESFPWPQERSDGAQPDGNKEMVGYCASAAAWSAGTSDTSSNKFLYTDLLSASASACPCQVRMSSWNRGPHLPAIEAKLLAGQDPTSGGRVPLVGNASVAAVIEADSSIAAGRM